MQAMQEIQVGSLGWKDPLEEETQSTPAFMPEEPHGQRSLEGYCVQSRKESDTTEQLSMCMHAC